MIDKGETAIENVKHPAHEVTKTYYDLYGRRLDVPQGFCVEKRSDGSSKVVYVKARK
jgi:hypothetical protein